MQFVASAIELRSFVNAPLICAVDCRLAIMFTGYRVDFIMDRPSAMSEAKVA